MFKIKRKSVDYSVIRCRIKQKFCNEELHERIHMKYPCTINMGSEFDLFPFWCGLLSFDVGAQQYQYCISFCVQRQTLKNNAQTAKITTIKQAFGV